MKTTTISTADYTDINLVQTLLKNKFALTLQEAAEYFNIGISRLKKITNSEDCSFVLWVGTKRLIKREQMEKFLEKSFSI